MIRFLGRRALGAALVLLVMAALVYALFYAMPGDPAVLACGKGCTAPQLEAVRHSLGTDRPVYEQFWSFLTGVFAGHSYSTGPTTVWCSAPCLGYSFQGNEPVTQMLLDRLPVDVSLTLGAAVLWLALGIGTGLFAALKPGGLRDRITNTLMLTLGSAPSSSSRCCSCSAPACGCRSCRSRPTWPSPTAPDSGPRTCCCPGWPSRW
ncbi:hypothetical protein ACFQZC_30940 [Streptacidiphilus monticola]